MTTIEQLGTFARALAGEAWDNNRWRLRAQAHVRREAAKPLMKPAERIRCEDALLEDPPEGYCPNRPRTQPSQKRTILGTT